MQAKERLKNYLEKKFGLTARQISAVLKSAREETIARGTILQQPGQKARDGWFVAEGCLRSYIIDGKGKEHILQFAPEEWLVSDLHALLTDTGAAFYIDAIEDSRVFRFGHELNLMFENNKPQRILPLVRSHRATQQRLIGILSKSAEERYSDFLHTYPSLAQRLPLGMIASYIGVTPQSLSRIRRSYAAK